MKGKNWGWNWRHSNEVSSGLRTKLTNLTKGFQNIANVTNWFSGLIQAGRNFTCINHINETNYSTWLIWFWSEKDFDSMVWHETEYDDELTCLIFWGIGSIFLRENKRTSRKSTLVSERLFPFKRLFASDIQDQTEFVDPGKFLADSLLRCLP